ncbi:hypothetical protein ABZ806_25320 [Spirillospora sp. NPDC047418]
MRTRRITATALALTAAATTATAVTAPTAASAAGTTIYTLSCSRPGVSGTAYISVTYTDPGWKISSDLWISDTEPDGHHAAIQSYAHYSGGEYRSPWYHVYGNGTTKLFRTSGTTPLRPYAIWMRAYLYEGGDRLQGCTTMKSI